MENRIKRTYICKDVNAFQLNESTSLDYCPKVGDVAVFEVIKIGKHKNVQSDSKRIVTIVPGDRIMAAFGTRYATEQFEGYLPESVGQELHILGAGGTVGVVSSMHAKFRSVGPTTLRFIGMAKDHYGNVINTIHLKNKQLISFSGAAASTTRVVLSLGASMDSGKTTTAAYLVRGLKNAGLKVAYIKLTGTVYTKDKDLAFDLGADAVADFSDFGYPSTYMCDEDELLDIYESTLASVLPIEPDYVIMEIADGIYQRETKMLLNCSRFIDTIETSVFSAGDSLAAINGVNTLQQWGIYPNAICGLLTTSPLLIKEVTENTTVPVYTLDQLSKGESAISSLALPVSNLIN